MKLVIIESPYRAKTEAEIERNVTYRQMCIRDSVFRGESPYASHQMLTSALNDDEPTERDIGIRCGYAWWRAASTIAFYIDLGWSEGMLKAYARAKTQQLKIEERRLAHHQYSESST